MTVEEIKGILSKYLTPRELARIERSLELIFRDRRIRGEFAILRQRMGAKAAREYLAEKYFLSEDHIDYIVYERRRSNV